jgi:hypothetical protein
MTRHIYIFARFICWSFNTTGMGRGYVGADGKPTIMFTANENT